MSKYIIDIPNVIEWGVVTCRTEDEFYTRDFDSLDELNSDYINEHFGDLQDTAYQKGFEDGKKEAESSEAIEQAKADAFNKGILFKEEKIHDAYQRGLEEGKAQAERGCEGCQWEDRRSCEICETCCNKYQNQYQAKQTDDEIKVGDIVERYLNGKLDSTGIYLGEDGDYWNCLFWTGAVFGTFAYPKNQFKKTEKHVDIASILEAMKHETIHRKDRC